ncbi:1-hydroxy-2-methyl-2-butenyl 4-diphosphate reductase [Streptomyces sp. NPDC059740]|uniref:phosphorylase family protein n=1 Tax=Streptomyces sp. NPDC059740 TaxID=3346926 RepID=UPI0036533D24
MALTPPTSLLEAEPPLVVACALGIEKFALRGLQRTGTTARAVVLRTGMGPDAARRAVTEALRERPGLGGSPVVATGFCAGLAPGMRPGDVVVADATRDHRPCGDDLVCETNALLVRSLRARGLRVHTGLLRGSDHVVRGSERAALHADGAVAVDMESAATLRAALAVGPRPVAAVRVVVDAPGHELVRIGTVRGGISAFRVLHAVRPVFFQWHRSLLLPRR